MGSQLAKARSVQLSTNRSPAVFWPGEQVQGRLVVDLVEDVVLKAARVWLTGTASSKWQEATSTISDRHELFKLCQFLDLKGQQHLTSITNSTSSTQLDSGTLNPPSRSESERVRFANDECTVVCRGTHLHSFRLRLPSVLPLSSFRLENDSAVVEVRYFLQLQVTTESDDECNLVDELIFVINEVDLSRQCPALKLPVQIEKQLALRQCCVGKGSISCTVKLDKGAYVPGEMMHVFVDILNESSKLVSGTRVTLEQQVQSYSRLRAQTLTSFIFSILGHRIKANSEAQYHDVVHVPPLPPTTIDSSDQKIVSIRYFVQVVIEMSNWVNRSVRVNVPVVIGTVPFRKKHITTPKIDFAAFDFETGNIRIYGDAGAPDKSAILYPYYR